MQRNGDAIEKTNTLPADRPAQKHYRNEHNPKRAADDDKRRVLETCVKQIIDLVDENPERDGLRDTPMRVARWWMDSPILIRAHTTRCLIALKRASR